MKRDQRNRSGDEPPQYYIIKNPPSDPPNEMPGDVLRVPDKLWGFEAVGRTDHPGACVYCYPDGRNVAMAKGGSRIPKQKYRANYVIVEPDEDNGLSAVTAFSTQPQSIRLKKLLLFYPERFKGKLPEMILNRLRWAMGAYTELEKAS